MIRKRSYLEDLTTSAAIPDVVGGFSVRKRPSTPTITGVVDRLYRSVTQIFRKKKKNRKVVR